MAAELKRALGIDAKLEVGSSGEFTVWVDQQRVADKQGGQFPDPDDVVNKVAAAISSS